MKLFLWISMSIETALFTHHKRHLYYYYSNQDTIKKLLTPLFGFVKALLRFFSELKLSGFQVYRIIVPTYLT
jgi:hypothetical protein